MRRIVVLASLSLLALTAVRADAGMVSVEDNSVSPEVTALTAPGEVVTWDWDTGLAASHNVRENSVLFYSGPLTSDDTELYEATFSAGVFHYYCELHGTPAGAWTDVSAFPR